MHVGGWNRNITHAVESECIGKLTLRIKRASFVKAIKHSSALLSRKKKAFALDDCVLYVCARLGECCVFTAVDPENGRHPIWEEEFNLDVSDPSSDLRLTLWHTDASDEDVCIGRVILPLIDMPRQPTVVDEWWDILPIAPKVKVKSCFLLRLT